MAGDKLPDDLVEPKVLAHRLSVHLSTIHRWIAKGRLRAWRRAGERYLISLSEGMALIVEVPVEPSELPRSRGEEINAAEQARERLRKKWGG